MPLPMPKLDDRSYQDLLEEAYRFIEERHPDWDIRAPSDMGNVLIECFAHLSEVMLYRLNRLPERVYREFLQLLGAQQRPPAAARALLLFSRENTEHALVIPALTEVQCSVQDDNGKPINFITNHEVTLKVGETSIQVPAYHCQRIAAEIIGTGTGKAGLELSVKRAPIIAPSSESDDDLLIGVALSQSESAAIERSNERIINHDGIAFRIWREVPDFSDTGADAYAFIADRQSGLIQFAPRLDTDDRALAAVPPRGARICAWYRFGGGNQGNVAPHTLTNLRTAIPGLSVTNPERALGGCSQETVEQALLRGPQHVQSLRRAVTARDFERLALSRQPALARARAYAKAEVWPQAQAGTVSLLLAPRLPLELEGKRISRTDFESLCQDETLIQVAEELEDRRPLGTKIDVHWARCKEIAVHAKVICHRDARPSDVQSDIVNRINHLLCPVSVDGEEGAWPFGRTLHASHLYALILGSPGVRYIEGELSFLLEHAPDTECQSLSQDVCKPSTWYLSSKQQLFRSTNAGKGWELIHALPYGQRFQKVEAHPRRPGILAAHVITEQVNIDDENQTPQRDQIILGENYGESWRAAPLLNIASEIEDFVWLPSDEHLQLFAACDHGLYDVSVERSPILIDLGTDAPSHNSFYAVCCERDALGRFLVAVAAQHGGGVYLSENGGQTKSFQCIGLKGQTIRCLSFQRRGTKRLLWAGFSALGDEAGNGASRIDMEQTALGWESFTGGWRGGSCITLRPGPEGMLAASHHAGVLSLKESQDARWRVTNIGCGLPIREDGVGLITIRDLAILPDDEDIDDQPHILVATDAGLYRCDDQRFDRFFPAAGRQQTKQVTLHSDWLFASSEHQISIEVETIA